MGVGIEGPPNQYPAGLEFDYSVWSANTRLDLLNVAWNNDYRDVVRFANKDALNTYIDSKSSAGITLTQTVYAKPGQDVYLNIPYNRVNRYNYLRASNPLMPIPDDIQKDFYYFILDCEYISPNTTRLRLQLDIWQTYVYDVTFGNCFVERGHIGIANENAFRNYGRDYLTIPEGLDIGGEYLEMFSKNVDSMHVNNADILAISSTDLRASGTSGGKPILKSAPGGRIQMMPSGASGYVWRTITDFIAWMTTHQDEPWVTQGIMSITMIPDSARYDPGFTYSHTGSEPSNAPSGPAQTLEHSLWDNWREYAKELLPERYRILEKFLTYPYLVIEFTTYTGSPIILKPESWANDDGLIEELGAIVPPGQRIVYTPKDYNTANIGSNASFERDGDWLNLSVQISNFPTLPIVNNGAIGYLAANQNSIAWQKANAEWTQNRALGMAQGGYDIASGAMRTMANLSGTGVNADIAQTANQNRTLGAQALVNSLAQAGSGIGNALTPGGFGGSAVSGLVNGGATAINAGIQTSANDEALAIRNIQAAESLIANQGQSQLVRDTNKSLADWGAKGDYASAIAGINAKVQDAALIQPSTSSQFGGEAFNLINQVRNFAARWKMIDGSAIAQVGEFWLRYGYSIHRFIQPPQDLKVMSKFSYWKMLETYIASANVPEAHKQVLRGMLEKGITVWDDPEDIGQIDVADNMPIGGIAY